MAKNEKISSDDKFFKTVITLIISTATPAIVFIIIICFMVLFNVLKKDSESWKWLIDLPMFLISGAMIILFVSSLHTLIFGIPLFLVGLRYNLIRWWTTLIGAFTVGFMPYTIMMLILEIIEGGITQRFSVVLVISSVLGLFGVSGGISFWLTWQYWEKKETLNTNANI